MSKETQRLTKPQILQRFCGFKPGSFSLVSRKKTRWQARRISWQKRQQLYRSSETLHFQSSQMTCHLFLFVKRKCRWTISVWFWILSTIRKKMYFMSRKMHFIKRHKSSKGLREIQLYCSRHELSFNTHITSFTDEIQGLNDMSRSVLCHLDQVMSQSPRENYG